jgi:hypothetical protein
MENFKLPSFQEVFGSLSEHFTQIRPPCDDIDETGGDHSDTNSEGAQQNCRKTCRKKQRQSISYQTGMWTEEEHENFLFGVCKYGHNWKKLAKIVPTRSVRQLKTHAKSLI